MNWTPGTPYQTGDVVKTSTGSARCLPKRIQWSRFDGAELPDNTVNVQRPYALGNPFTVQRWGRAGAVRRFKGWILGTVACDAVATEVMRTKARNALKLARGKDVACACGLKELCHGDTVLELANA